jgi:N-acetylglucosaminyldiphosphoundecaprenol N-acetyl-beta-D-mannosaminyltransferase
MDGTHGTGIVLGTRCFAGDQESASMHIIERVRTGAGGYVCQANAHVLVTACRDRQLRRALDAAWVVHPDGSAVSWLMRRLGAESTSRIAGADLMSRLLADGTPIGLRHYLFGSTPQVLQKLEAALSSRHPRAKIVGSLAPPFGRLLEEHAERHVDTMRAATPDVVWCALGAPKQELWMHRYAPRMAPAIVIGVGAAFEFHAGTKQRAPAWMQKSGLEWAHRLASEPRRLAGRYVSTNSEFVLRAALGILTQRRLH